nr:RagB/SusD family nutrient uptake outer membrane protein [uncultured Sediminibacterium sp.]
MKTYQYTTLCFKGLLWGLFLFAFMSCQKQKDWLDARVNLNSVVPSRLQDYQAMLNADYMFQGQGFLSVVGNGQFSLSEADFNAISVGVVQKAYIWAKDIYEGLFNSDWEAQYKMVAVSNVCLEGLEKIQPSATTKADYDQVKGSAHFYRGLAFYQLLQVYAPHYLASSASTDFGIPLRLSSDVNLKYNRSSVKDCYDQIIKDLETSISLLSDQSNVQVQPTKTAAKALLARIYLVMEKWNEAAQLAGEVLTTNSSLLDFNTLSVSSSIPFPTLQNKHPEVIHYQQMDFFSGYSSNNTVFDSLLYQSYALNDLRRAIFFRLVSGKPIFKGYYTGITGVPFGGIATNEVYLIRSEALARTGNINMAMQVLNELLQKRWRTGTYVPITASNQDEAVKKIIEERRKELPFTGNLVWTDLRRLNSDSRFAKTLKRVVGSSIYELLPNSIRYVLPIPDVEIKLTGITQNPR